MVQSDNNWSAGLFQQLELLSNHRLNADVILWAGTLQIPTHKFVLDTYSDIMKSEDAHFNATEKMYHVVLSGEFEENVDLLCSLIKSLYDGFFEVGDVNAKFVYKFAKIYNVEWLKIKTFALFDSILTETTFIEIFQFSHLVCCEDLKGLCLDYLTPNFLSTLVSTGELLKIDYHCLHTIINANYSSVLSEIEKFRLVCKWFEADVFKRICHIGNFISFIEFNAMEKSDLHLVFDWVLNEKNLDDNFRMNLMKEVNAKANTPIPQATESPIKHTNLKSIQRTLRRMKHTVKGSDGQSLVCYFPGI